MRLKQPNYLLPSSGMRKTGVALVEVPASEEDLGPYIPPD